MTMGRRPPVVGAALLGTLVVLLALSAPWAEAGSPSVTATDPPDGAIDVRGSQPILVTFSLPMDNASVTWTIVPFLDLTPSWSVNNTLLTLDHAAPFASMTMYTASVAGNDSDGHPLVPGAVPNPWTFSTSCSPCYITSTDPADGDTNVPLDKNVTVVFSNPPEPATLTWTVAPAIAFTPTWPDPTTLVLSHAAPFRECTLYTIGIFVSDLFPGPVPNPWSFSTASSRACILWTAPADGERDVPLRSGITAAFSAPVDPADLLLPSVVPTVGPWVLSWSLPMDILTITSLGPLSPCTVYTVTMSDRFGPVPGLVPNPWSFETVCTGPFITATDPRNGTVDVPLDAAITVSFSEPMDPAGVTWTLTPSVGLAASWPDPSTLRLTPTPALPRCTGVIVRIEAPNLSAGPVPNPWAFTARCFPPSAPAGLTATAGNARVTLTWHAPSDDGGTPVTAYRVYRGLAPGSETLRTTLGNVLVFVDSGLTNGVAYTYQVSAMNAAGEGPRSAEASATPENLPPVCNILAPPDGANLSGVLVIRGTATDPDGGAIARVEVRIDGGPWMPAQGAEAWSLPWNSTSVPDGPHAIGARAFDGEAYSAVAEVAVAVANRPPPPAIGLEILGAALALAVAVAALAILAFLLGRRRRGERSR